MECVTGVKVLRTMLLNNNLMLRVIKLILVNHSVIICVITEGQWLNLNWLKMLLVTSSVVNNCCSIVTWDLRCFKLLVLVLVLNELLRNIGKRKLVFNLYKLILLLFQVEFILTLFITVNRIFFLNIIAAVVQEKRLVVLRGISIHTLAQYLY